LLVGHFIFETKVHLFETQELKPETMNIDQKPGDDEDGSEFTDQQSNMSEDVAHGLDSSFATMDQPKMVRTCVSIKLELDSIALGYNFRNLD
jgi:hypothetical protein